MEIKYTKLQFFVVVYKYKTQTVTVKVEHSLGLLENKFLKRICGLKRNKLKEA
jgi:hypothetical protein